MHPNLLQRQLILMGGFEHCALFSGETTAEKLKNILDRLLADKNDWTNDFGDKHEFQKALEKDVEVAKIAIMQSFLRRKEQDPDEKEAEKFFYRWSSRYLVEEKKPNKDLSGDYIAGRTICIDRYLY